MARSQYIYVILSQKNKYVLGTFTVKWEMERWLELQGEHLPPYEVWRTHDGLWQHEHSPVQIK